MRTAPAGKFSDAWDKSAPSPPACLKLTANSFPPPFSSACLSRKWSRVSAITPSSPPGSAAWGRHGGGHLHGNPLLRFRGGFDCQDPGVAFPGKQRLPPAGRILHPQRQPSGPGSGYDGKRAAPRIITAPAHPATPALPEIPAGKVPEGTMLNGASLCPQCHSLAYVQDGKCKSCRSCGYKDGGCGE